MAKFGELLADPRPVVIMFNSDWNEQVLPTKAEFNELCTEMGDTTKKIIIDVDKNEDLAMALGIKVLPTVMVYKDGQRIFKQSGPLDRIKIMDACAT